MTKEEALQVSTMVARAFPRCRWTPDEWKILAEQMTTIKGVDMEQARAVVHQHRTEYDYPKLGKLVAAMRRARQEVIAKAGPEDRETTAEDLALITQNVEWAKGVLNRSRRSTWEKLLKQARPTDGSPPSIFGPWYSLSWNSLVNSIKQADAMPYEQRRVNYLSLLACRVLELSMEAA